jgi:hypothetical protein
VDGRPRGGHRPFLNSNSNLVDRTWINKRPGGARRWKGETVGREGRRVVCRKPTPSRMYPPLVSVNDRWVSSHEQVLNVPIAYRCYEPDKPSSWLSIKACLSPIVSLAVVGEKLSTNPQIRHPSNCGLCQESFFSGAVDLYKSVDDFIKGCYALTMGDTYGLEPYADWA